MIRLPKAVLIAPAAFAAIVIAPLLRSATAPASPTFTETNLVSDVPGMARRTDPNLVNAWGMTLGLNSALWVAENHNGPAESFDGNGQLVPGTSGSPSTSVTVPAPGGGLSAPTGVPT